MKRWLLGVCCWAPVKPLRQEGEWRIDGTKRDRGSRGSGEIESHDYLPFGEERCDVGVRIGEGGQSRRFTGKERDAETGAGLLGREVFAS